MKLLLPLAWAAAIVLAQSSSPETPLSSLPYSPSLDVSSMDRSANPCTDFYRYSCGGWIKKNPIPPDQSRWDVYQKLTEDNLRFLWGILQQVSQPSAGRTAVEAQIGDFFYACMDEGAVQNAGATPLKPALDRIAALQSIADLPAYLAGQHLRGAMMMFDFGSNQDYANSSRVIAFANAGGLGLPDRDYYVKTDAKSQMTRQKYLEHVGKMLELLGESSDQAKAHAQTVMDIETALAKASFTRVELRDPQKLFHKMSAAQFEALTPSFRWDAYFAAAQVPDTSVVNVTEPEFYKQLQTLLKSRTLADWQTYLRWHLVHSYAPFLSSPFVNENFEFYSRHLRGLEQLPPRWKRCVREVDGELGEALGQVFVARTFGADTKARVQLMTKQIEDAMENEIRQLPWMSEATKKRALEKLHAVVNKIGKPVDRMEWQMTAPTVNAYYDPQMNDINFPAGVLQPPLYDPKTDDAPNYGDTGATIGHELTHGFDDEGRQFDAQGNLKNWWTKADAQSFEKAAKCVSDEYSGFTIVDNIKINGKLTLGEDLADLGGTWLAFLAWKEATKGQNLQPADGLTPDQRFFVGMAQWACGDERPESKRLNAVTNPHSPLEYRVNGVVSNMPDFGKAFSCRVGQPMVRTNQCKVW